MTTPKDAQVKPQDGKTLMDVFAYIGIVLTIAGQCIIGFNYIGGQACWLVSNLLYLTKAFGQNMGKSEIVRNVCMTGITAGLMIFYTLANL